MLIYLHSKFCEKQISSKWLRYWHSVQKTPYAVLGNQWIGYDDVESITLKSNFVNEQNLGGAMVWSVETDDFKGICGNGKYPLLSLINRIVRDYVPSTSSPPTAVPTSSTSTPTKTSPSTIDPPTNEPSEATTSDPPTGTTGTEATTLDPTYVCSENRTFRHPNECSIFFICAEGRLFQFSCPGDLVYDPLINGCNWRDSVAC